MSNPNRKPLPLFVEKPRVHCPVCGHVTYSIAGIHPQCAMIAADKSYIARIKAKQAAAPIIPVVKLRMNEKQCPACQVVIHVRRNQCNCGHVFHAAKIRSS